MNNATGGTAQQDSGGKAEDAGDIFSAERATRNLVIRLWNEHKPITEIADSTGLPLATVNRILKSAQKKFVRQKGEQP